MGNSKKAIDICKDSPYSSIFQICSKDVPRLMEFYLYRFAETNDSPLSLQLNTTLTDSQKNELFSLLLTKANIEENKLLFSPMLRNDIEKIRTLKLSDNTLNFNAVKGFFLINKKTNQHKLDCMFKRIRDSFAHGRIGIHEDFLVLEDKVNELTGRFIVKKDILLLWIEITETYIKNIYSK